jgi:hypothetical protein
MEEEYLLQWLGLDKAEFRKFELPQVSFAASAELVHVGYPSF